MDGSLSSQTLLLAVLSVCYLVWSLVVTASEILLVGGIALRKRHWRQCIKSVGHYAVKRDIHIVSNSIDRVGRRCVVLLEVCEDSSSLLVLDVSRVECVVVNLAENETTRNPVFYSNTDKSWALELFRVVVGLELQYYDL